MLYYLINKNKLDKGIVLKFGLKVLLGISYSLTKEIKHFGFFKKEMVIINTEFFLYLNPPIFKGRVYPIK